VYDRSAGSSQNAAGMHRSNEIDRSPKFRNVSGNTRCRHVEQLAAIACDKARWLNPGKMKRPIADNNFRQRRHRISPR
jgi:hypothetical protein